MLPYLGEESLYRRFDLTDSWNAKNNVHLIREMPSVFRCPFDPTAKAFMSSYVAVVGHETVFPSEGCVQFEEIKDTPTIAIIEIASSQIPWTKPQDMTFEDVARGPRSVLSPRDWAARFVLFVDGEIRVVSDKTDPVVWRSLLTIRGGETVGDDDF